MNVKIASLVAAIFVLAPALHSADKNPADYPIRLRIIGEKPNANRYGVHGSGRGRIDDGGKINGIDFEYDCDQKIGVNIGQEQWLAKWKKPGEVLTVISHDIGDSNMRTCDIKVYVRDFVYYVKDGHQATETQQQWAAQHPNGEHHPEDDAVMQP